MGTRTRLEERDFNFIPNSSHRVGHVDHSFGKVLGLAARATQLYKLWEDKDTQMMQRGS